ncbi:MAG: tRNA (adenosine(37)-N6)-dimethylallyltransferase MiaA [Anaerolineae bacterium]|nr:tRNA (adenosine(37)-N6)-dimethylallyltransferase MiaA [Anaerolineae bacterium]
MTGKFPPLLIILGPTAIGKTGLAIEVASRLNSEIIGADSRQVYRHMDVGTAKPTAKQQQAAIHHLVDVVTPNDNLTLAQYQRLAYTAIDDVIQRSKLPMLVGGTGQYLTAVEEGWSIPEVPPNDKLREVLEAEAVTIGNEAFHQKLVRVDPHAAEKIHPNNVRRVVRALEVYMETGTPISVLQQKQAPPYRIRTIGLRMEREALYEQADKRVELMIADGFVDEVQSLLDNGYAASLPSMTALGYREIVSYIQGEISLDEAIILTKNSTHDFIRRQEIWFRGHDNGILWHNILEIDANTVVNDIVKWMQE